MPNIVGGHGKDKKGLFTKGFKEIKAIFNELMKQKTLRRFLGAYFFYNMGVQTVMVMAVLFARKEILWPDEQSKTTSLIMSILIIQFIGIVGAFIFSALSKHWGNIKALMLAIFIWIFICVFTYLVAKLPIHFYIVAACVGLVMGGIQALSRSTYSKLLPETDDHASYFSFYDVMEKAGMIIGTISFGFIAEVSGGMRNSVLALICYFIVGFVLLCFVPKIKTNKN